MKIKKLQGSFGAKICNIDLKSNLEREDLEKIQTAFVKYQLLIFPSQKLQPEHQLTWTKHFGPVQKLYAEEHRIPDCPEVVVLSNEQINGKHVGVVAAGDYWHSDLSPSKNPGLATILYARRLPLEGGDTEFADMHMAYQTLSTKMRERIANLRGIHCVSKLRNHRVKVTRPGGRAYYKKQNEIPDVSHPLVRTHPVSGLKSLYLSPRFTIGIENMENIKAQPLLDELFAHQIKPEHVYRHKWKIDDLVMWDNRSLNHRACGGYKTDDIRRIHRTSTLGDQPF
jgi:taurine dioxygenase